MLGKYQKLELIKLCMVFAVILGLLRPCTLDARQRPQLADPQPTRILSGVVIAAPLFEEVKGNGWGAYKRPFEDPTTRLFGLKSNLLLYGCNGFKDNKDPAELASLKEKAGQYLAASPVIKKALQARQKARWVIVNGLTTGKSPHPEAKTAMASGLLRSWVDAPLIVFSRTPIPGMETQGPHAAPHPVAIYDSQNKCIAYDTVYMVLADTRSSGAGKTPFKIGSSVQNNTLDLVVCHEMAHGIMFDAYRRPANVSIGKGSSIHGHSTEYITDRQKAYLEGWAEAFEAFFGRSKSNLNALGESHYGVASFLVGRQDQVRRDRWLWLNGKANRAASMKNAGQMMACEGVIAGIFFDILSNRALVSPFEKAIEVMAGKKPADFPEFINAWLECFPGDRRVLLRIFLEHTRYATIDTGITASYQASYRARRSMKNHKGSNEEAKKAEKEYSSSKEAAFSRLQSSGNIFAALPEQLWFGIEYIARSGDKVTRFVRINLDLNTADAFLLNYSGLLKGKELEEFLARRDKEGGFRGKPLEILRDILGEDRFNKLSQEGFKLFPQPLSP